MSEDIKHVHFIGIGGVGMSGIAAVAHDKGMSVSGSDLRASTYTDKLKSAGIDVYIGHAPENIPQDTDVVVVSTAILDNNAELVEARRRNLPLWHRAKMLAALGCGLETLAVSGTHGKTTTSSMLAHTMCAIGLDPTFLIGGTVRKAGCNAHFGTGKYYVVEADESDKSFTYLSPSAVVVTNIETDHLDHYENLDEIYLKFEEFMASVPAGGAVVVCGDDAKLLELAKNSKEIDAHLITYGSTNACDFYVSDFKPSGVGSKFLVHTPAGDALPASLPQNPGFHNALNVCAVVALCSTLGISAEDVLGALSEFAGVRRRFDLVGSVGNVCVVDDYAHHPTEISLTIHAAKQLKFSEVHVLFQPHRYSRAKLFCDVLRDEFSHAFDEADTVTFMDVYPAGEAPVPGINGKTFLDVVMDSPNHPPAQYVAKRIEVPAHMAKIAKQGSLIITMGAGDVSAMGQLILDELQNVHGCGD